VEEEAAECWTTSSTAAVMRRSRPSSRLSRPSSMCVRRGETARHSDESMLLYAAETRIVAVRREWQVRIRVADSGALLVEAGSEGRRFVGKSAR
jgi:hypothetical protein